MTLRLAQVAEVRLGRQRAPQYEHGDYLIPYLRSANVVDGGLDLTDVKSMNFEPAEQTVFGLSDGDVLMTEGSGSAETVGTSAVWRGDLPGTVCFQNTLLRLRPRSGVTDGRFLAWWARHAHASGQIAAVASGANIQHIGSDGLKDLRIHVPDLDEQRRIADFLDDRVARIDQIITARRQQIALLGESHDAGLHEFVELASVGIPRRRLGAVATIGSGGFLPSTEFVDEGPVPVFGGNGFAGCFERANTHADAIVVGRVGALCGNVHLIESPTWVTDNALVVELREPTLSSAYVAAVLADRNLNRIASQTAQPLITGTQVGDQQIPLLAEAEQAEVVKRWRLTGDVGQGATLRRSIALLTEYKQSLITAAVTGEIDMTTTAGIQG